MQDDKHDEVGYPTFNALGRAAMILGIPVIPLALVMGGSLALTMLMLSVLKGKALLFMLIPIPVVIFMKTVSSKDDQALKIIGYELMCWFYRRNASFFNGTTTILATHFGRNLNDYQRFVEQHTEKTNLRRYVPSENIPTYHR